MWENNGRPWASISLASKGKDLNKETFPLSPFSPDSSISPEGEKTVTAGGEKGQDNDAPAIKMQIPSVRRVVPRSRGLSS